MDAVETFKVFRSVLKRGIEKAKKVCGGILPSYIYYEPSEYSVTDHINHSGYRTVKVSSFALKTLPPFLEASARCFKLGREFCSEKDIELIKQSGIYDDKLKIYKTCAPIDDAPFEIGRVHAFTKGWLERECNFLHMTYKYLLGLLKGGFYEQFYSEAKDNFVYNMDPAVYGRSPIENSSFIVPTCNPDSKLHGRGFFARLTGANAEMMNMYCIMFAGEHLFTYENGELCFNLEPKLSKDMFDANNEVSFRLFGTTDITYKNIDAVNCYEPVSITYTINGQTYDRVCGTLAEDIRNGKIKAITAHIRRTEQ